MKPFCPGLFVKIENGKTNDEKDVICLKISAGILAGGNSSRMGMDKICLNHEEDTFLGYLVKQCAFFPEILISLRNGATGNHGNCRVVLDEEQNAGPLEGIRQLLRAAENPAVLILAADMQYLTRDFLEKFAARYSEKYDCMILQSPRGIEPLCGIYSKSVLPQLEQAFQNGLRSPKHLFGKVRTHFVTAEELGMEASQLLYLAGNINTQIEYGNFLKTF